LPNRSDPMKDLLPEALAHHAAGRLDVAEELYRRILAVDPQRADVLGNLGNVLMYCGRIEDAVNCCRRAIAIEPGNAEIHSSLCYKLHFHPGYDRAAIFRELRQWDELHGGDSVVDYPVDRAPDRRLRVGYVSPDFYGHAECFFVLPLLEGHDRSNVETHCYASVQRPDRATQFLKSCAHVWHDVLNLSNDELATKIREDRIDILVDLTMHMAGNRLPMFAKRPAPVQVTWLAYPGGTGMKAMDNRLTDAWLDPPGEGDQYYAEQSVRLPDCWCCYHPMGEVPPAAPREEGPVVFGSLNSPAKLNDRTLHLWSAVLQAVPDSKLLLLADVESQKSRIAEMIDPRRLEFTGYCRRGEYLRVYDRIDVCLDPLPYNGITTTCDALWMGVPVVSRVGSTAAGRAGLGILSTVGLPEFAAADDDGLVKIAANLARDYPRRSELRRNLRDRMRRSPTMDGRRFARNAEAAYREMWRKFCGV
jgi:protein O-GlcNAc transferase